ncbi:hypothetical protein ABT026_05275 [Streptomyces sp. NPDC002734]|uniref:hypothetical protein n=1 Tax=Streptomyces sp. NPDC002734 TaxID=3154426 RepID=UPI003330F1B6
MTVVQDGSADLGVHRRQRVLLAGAWACVVLGTACATYLAAGLVPVFVVVAAPLGVTLRRGLTHRSFARRCAILSGYLTVMSVLGAFFALFLFLPAALLLAAAAAAGPRRGRIGAAALTGLGRLVVTAAVAGVLWGAWELEIGPRLAEPHTFRATITATDDELEEMEPPAGQLEHLGATDVFMLGNDSGWTLQVRFPDDLPEDRRDQLRAAIVSLEDVSDDVELCPVRECG